MNRYGLGFSKLLLKNLRGLERLLLGFDQGEVAIIHTRAAHQSAHDFRRIVAQLFEKRFSRQSTDQRVRNKRVAEKSGREVDYDDIVKGYEVDKGEYVIVEPEELEQVAPEPTRTIEIEDFVDLAEIDPIYFEKSYYLAPEQDAGAERADRKSTRLNSSHVSESRMPSSA